MHLLTTCLRPRRILFWSALLALFWPISALAQLYAITHDAAAQRTEIAIVDTASGVVSPIAGGMAGFELGLALVANDPFSEQIYTLGPDPVAADGTWRLVRFDLATGNTQVIGNTASTERVLSLDFELSTQRLVAAVAPSGSTALRLVSVDTATAVFTEIHTGLANCCILSPGVSALAGGSLYMSGRLATDVTTITRLFGFSTSGDNVTTTPMMTGDLAVLSEDPATGVLYGLRQTTTGLPISAILSLVQVNTNGILSNVGAPMSDCCALAIDVSAIETGQLRVVARPLSDSTPSLLSFDLVSGVASFSTSPLPGGRVINGLFDQRKGLAPTTTSITAVVPDPVAIGNSYNVAVLVTAMSGSPTGSITVSDGLGNSCLIVAPAGNCNLPAVAAGIQNIFAAYASNGFFAGSSDSTVVQVDRALSLLVIDSIVPSPSQVGNNYVVGVSVSGFGTPGGSINVDDGLGNNCTITLPATSCTLGSVNAGLRTISANYVGDVNNQPSSTSASHEVLAAPSTTSIDSITPSPSVVGQSYVVAASVVGFGVPTGMIQVDDGAGNICMIVLPSLSCALTSTSTGPTTITAVYAGDLNNLSSSASAPHTVDPAISTTLVTLISPMPAEVGQSYDVTVQVTGFGIATGSIAVDDGTGANCVITLPTASCSLVSVTVGARTITAAYSGDLNNLPSMGSAAQTITQATPSITLSTSPNPSVVGNNYAVSALVTGFITPTGTLNIDDGLGGNCAFVLPATSCNLGSINAGLRTITASYTGDANNFAGNTTASHMVSGAPSTTSIDSVVPSPSIVGTSYTVAASVAGFGVATGVIQVDDGVGANCTISLPATSCALTSMTAGARVLTAIYGGDLNNLPSNDSVAHTVDRAASLLQITALNPSPAVAGQAYGVSVSVTGFGLPAGTVSVDDGAGASCLVTLPGTSCNLVSTIAGSLTISANYSGGVNNLPSSDSAGQVINPAIATLALSATPNPVSRGAPLLLTATVGGGVDPITGSVSFSAGGNPIAACSALAVAARQAICSTRLLTPGDIQISATYSGDANNTNANASLIVGVMATPIPALGYPGLLALILIMLLFGALTIGRRRRWDE